MTTDRTMTRLTGRFVIVFAMLMTLGGCEWLTGPGGIFGDEIEVPLPGDRISILRHQRSLTPDPELSSSGILLPAPSPNADWPQAGGYANHAMHHIQVNDSINFAWQTDIGSGASDEVHFIGVFQCREDCRGYFDKER